MTAYDIVIVGSGIVGLTTALLLAKNPNFNIAILEANAISSTWNKETIDHRVSAISLASKKLFQELDVFNTITAKRFSSYTKMQVWDATGKGKIHFDCRDVNERELGLIIEDSVTRSSLLEKITHAENIHLLPQTKLIALAETNDAISLTTENNKTIQARLLIGADGALSLVRDLAQIELQTKDYEHTAIVATVQTAVPHDGVARQRFLTTGPLAFLPMSDKHTCSIVWSTSHDHAKALLEKNEIDFKKTLSAAFDNQLGEIQKVSTRFHFPLRMRHAKNYVKNRIALIGDAAHTIHPLAGQGVNLGLLDAKALSKTILEASSKDRDFASFATLRRYERERKGHNLIMLKAVAMLKQFFATEAETLCALRTLGLKATQRWPLLKDFFVNYALGKSTF